MTSKRKKLLKNMTYSLSGTAVTLIISAIGILIIPKLLSISDFSYYQIYLFYLGFVGVFHFGWADGIYLELGGKSNEDLISSNINNQILLYAIIQLIISVVVAFSSFLVTADQQKLLTVIWVSVAISIVNVKIVLMYILQAIGRIKEYSLIQVIDRAIFILLVALLLIMKNRNYSYVIIADLTAKLTTLLITVYLLRTVVVRNWTIKRSVFNETLTYIKSGISLMLANFASMLLIGIVKYGIEKAWNISTFGGISLILNVTNIIIGVIGAVGLVVFPMLKQENSISYNAMHNNADTVLTVMLTGMLLLYYPVYLFLHFWLPQYDFAIKYLFIIYPIFSFEGKMLLLINPFLKTLRMEKKMMLINIISMLASTFSTWVFGFIFHSLRLLLLALTATIALRTALSAVILSKNMNIKRSNALFSHSLLSVIFIISNLLWGDMISFFIFSVSYIAYLILIKDEFQTSLKYLVGNK